MAKRIVHKLQKIQYDPRDSHESDVIFADELKKAMLLTLLDLGYIEDSQLQQAFENLQRDKE